MPIHVMRTFAFIALFAVNLLPVHAEDIIFEKDILPLFESRCFACHSPQAEKLKGKLDLSTYANVMKGGGTGPAIVPGKPEESYLLNLVQGIEEPKMPPKNFKELAPEEIEMIKGWVAEGAKGGGIATPPEEMKKEEEVAAAAGNATPPPSEAEAAAPKFEPVSAMAFSPKGNLLARGGLHKVDLIETTDSGEMNIAATFEGHADLVRSLTFSSDGARLAAAGGRPARGGEVKIWNVADRTLLRTISGHADNIFDATFSPDGKLIATCSYDKMVKLWSVETGEEVRNLKDHVDAVFAVAFSPDGKYLASASGDRTVKIWETETGKRLLTLSDSLGPVYTVAFHPTGNLVAAGGADKMIRVWDIAQSLASFTQSSLTGAAQIKSSLAHDAALLKLIYSADGKTIYTTAEDKRIKAWDAETLTARAFDPQSDWVMAMALSPDGSRLAVGRYDASSTLYDAASGRVLSFTGRDPAELAQSGTKERKKITSLDVENIIVNTQVPASIQSLSPDRITAGTTVTLTINGISLDDPDILVHNPHIKARLVSNEKLPIPELKRSPGDTGAFIIDNAQSHKITCELVVGAEAPVGTHSLMIRTAHGMTGALGLIIPPWPDTGEAEPNNTREQAQAIASFPAAIPAAMNAAGDADLYKVSAKAGQEIVFALTDVSMEGAAMRLLDASGAELVTSGFFQRGDQGSPRLGHRCETDGDYFLEVTDATLGMGGYRLQVGEFPYVYDVYPLGVPAGPPVKVQVRGFNIGGVTEMEIDPPDAAKYGDTVDLPVPGYAGSPIGAPRVAVGSWPSQAEAEPNNEPAAAQTLAVPSVVDARIESAGGSDHDLYRVKLDKNQRVLIETMAARLDSPLDTLIEILASDGKPLEQATIRCVAQTVVTLSDRDSSGAGIRIENWTDLGIGDYAMVGSEIIKVQALPDYADEDVAFASWVGGGRRGFFGTTPRHIAVNTPLYKVEVHPPGMDFPPNGLPVHRIYWRNDDVVFEGARSGDSYLEFVAPEGGDYLIRVSDVNESGGPLDAYRLMLRTFEPEFDFNVGPYWPNVTAGGSVPLDVRIRRKEGFDAPVHVRVEGLPEGFTVNEDTVPGDVETIRLALTAAPDAKSTVWDSTVKFTATTTLNGAEVTREARIGSISVKSRGDLRVNVDARELAVEPGGTGAVNVTLDRFNGFTSRVPLDVLNLPFGVYVLDTGLNGILVRDEEYERGIRIFCEPWVRPMTRKIYVQAQIETRSARPVFISREIELKIGGGATPAGEIAAKP